jgi:hypothetical protein
VRLDSSRLSDLIVDASNAYRIYELMLINRPGDVWSYVSVGIETAPESVFNRLKHVREKGKIGSSQYPWSLEEVPFKVFDKIFYWDIDGTEPADAAWLNRDASAMNKYAEQLLGIARKAQESLNLGWNGDLVGHIVALVKSGKHPYDFLEREAAIAMHGRKLPLPEHTDDFYKKLRELLCEPDLASITYFGDGDYTILKMLATEQRRRINLTQHSPDHAIQIVALVNQTIDNGAWDSTIHFCGESYVHGDLFIQGYGLMRGEPWVEVPRSDIPGRHILSIRDEGDIQGFSKTSGDGWFHYTRKKPNDRRLGLECRSSPQCLVLNLVPHCLITKRHCLSWGRMLIPRPEKRWLCCSLTGKTVQGILFLSSLVTRNHLKHRSVAVLLKFQRHLLLMKTKKSGYQI